MTLLNAANAIYSGSALASKAYLAGTQVWPVVGFIVGFDPTTITGVTLSGGNLVVTNTGTTSADQGAHVASTSGKPSGKYYFETTVTSFLAGTNVAVGVGTPASTYTNMGNTATSGTTVRIGTGAILYNGGSSGSSLAACVTGNVIGIAVDLDHTFGLYFRIAPSGNWNGSGTANPATNTGGINKPAGALVPFNVFGGTGGVANNVLTTNFGATAFMGAVPSGFTAGWPL
jgi:hypothetical protein